MANVNGFRNDAAADFAFIVLNEFPDDYNKAVDRFIQVYPGERHLIDFLVKIRKINPAIKFELLDA